MRTKRAKPEVIVSFRPEKGPWVTKVKKDGFIHQMVKENEKLRRIKYLECEGASYFILKRQPTL
jgi:hypothetical protein